MSRKLYLLMVRNCLFVKLKKMPVFVRWHRALVLVNPAFQRSIENGRVRKWQNEKKEVADHLELENVFVEH
ncbi:unnamed protein product [Phyllotreta striolata]|uniref:Uncharacterized protein n=1 Tax=Phyllotreta striolata TaxID=444603 RepID=A0A9N9XKP9_PHYSR|nr:unnamed protein product [Phyllotreta striolata]